MSSSAQTAAQIARWFARCVSILVLLFFGFFILAHVFGDGEEGGNPLVASDYVMFAAMGAFLIGLIVGWFKEQVGGVMVLLGWVIIASGGIQNVLNPYFGVVAVTGVAFLLSWMLRRDKAETGGV